VTIDLGEKKEKLLELIFVYRMQNNEHDNRVKIFCFGFMAITDIKFMGRYEIKSLIVPPDFLASKFPLFTEP
jgi:hypothetical protein